VGHRSSLGFNVALNLNLMLFLVHLALWTEYLVVVCLSGCT